MEQFDTADRALWAQRYKGMCCQLHRHEVDLSDQHKAIEEVRKLDLDRQVSHEEILVQFATMREQLAVSQQQVAELKEQLDKITKHLKERFAGIKSEITAMKKGEVH